MNSLSIEPSTEGLAGPGPSRPRLRGRLRSSEETGSMLRAAAAQHAIHGISIGYWAVFWLMNGLDKFLNRSDVMGVHWYGKDRSKQFGEYFSRLDLAPGAIDGLLVFTGIWEFLVALPLIGALVALLLRPVTERASKLVQPLIYWGYFLTGLTLIGFSAFDVVAGDRAELREHGLYLALMFVCCLWSARQDRTDKPYAS